MVISNDDIICPSATWARTISDTVIEGLTLDTNLVWNIEYLQQYLPQIKINHPLRYNKYLKHVEDFIKNSDLEEDEMHQKQCLYLHTIFHPVQI